MSKTSQARQRKKKSRSSREKVAERPGTRRGSALEVAPVLKITVLVTGAVLMALEVTGSRVLAPYAGSSVFVWGSLISVFLAAMSVGYYWGGNLADRSPHLKPLARVLILAGVTTWMVPLLSGLFLSIFLQLGLGARFLPLVGSFALFFLPSMLLAAATPYILRLSAKTINLMGGLAGRLYALSTVGSIAGTLLATFVLIPSLGIKTIFYLLGTVSIMQGILIWPRSRRVATGVVTICVVGIGFIWLPPTWSLAPRKGRILYQKDTPYHAIFVTEDAQGRYLQFNRSRQSAISLVPPYETLFAYPKIFQLVWLFNTDLRHVLMIGLGGGTTTRALLRISPKVRVDAVELDPHVVQVARRFFYLKSNPRLRINVQDGRRFLGQTEQRYDAIFLDAYFGERIPFHMTTLEFFRLLRSRLQPNGVLAANLIGALTGKSSRLTRSFITTLKEIFPQVYAFPEIFLSGRSLSFKDNVILIGTLNNRRVLPGELIRLAHVKMRTLPGLHRNLKDLAAIQWEGIEFMKPGVTLRDDYAPVDALQY